jgi:hypothetical protein
MSRSLESPVLCYLLICLICTYNASSEYIILYEGCLNTGTLSRQPSFKKKVDANDSGCQKAKYEEGRIWVNAKVRYRTCVGRKGKSIGQHISLISSILSVTHK